MVRDDDPQHIAFVQPAVHPRNFAVDRDAVRRLILGSGDIVGDEFPLVKYDISRRPSLIRGICRVGQDPP